MNREHLELYVEEDDYDKGFRAGRRVRGVTDYRLAALVLAGLSGFLMGAALMWILR